MLLTWLGAAGFKLDTSEGATLLIDPYLSRPATASPQLPIQLADLFPVDEIFLTNGRFDHSMDALALTRQTGAIVHASAAVCQRLADMGVSAHCLQIVDSEHRKSLGSLTWQARPSRVNQLDSSLVLRALTRQPTMLPEIRALDRQWPLGGIVAYDFQAEGISLIHFGSAAWIEGEIDQLHPDIALIPVEHEPEAEAACVHLANLLKPKLVIPHHWDDYFPPLSQTIDSRRFKSVMQTLTSGIDVYIPTIGQSFDPAELL